MNPELSPDSDLESDLDSSSDNEEEEDLCFDSRIDSSLLSSSSGVLLSSRQVCGASLGKRRIALGTERSRGMGTVVDRLEVETLRPLKDYSKDGLYFLEQRRRSYWKLGSILIAVFTFLLLMFYSWWMIPFYKMPAPQHWMKGMEKQIKLSTLRTKLKLAGISSSLSGIDDAGINRTVWSFLFEDTASKEDL
eukprot:CAMPEP_0196572408 /NCGR_PEP_ID=MMETSP1081-20130531/2472_1 /TAXON_ID=36882 /ORGANISM="Pyramimonas amylifera, Strain CCMP720" /LENGTH=191 /DNA_ID=CAMNT_0041889725 /DNA_START=407 /DNA_END=982 /DNA_ORIENTATION=-